MVGVQEVIRIGKIIQKLKKNVYPLLETEWVLEFFSESL